jgi:hypothetical protein
MIIFTKWLWRTLIASALATSFVVAYQVPESAGKTSTTNSTNKKTKKAGKPSPTTTQKTI